LAAHYIISLSATLYRSAEI